MATPLHTGSMETLRLTIYDRTSPSARTPLSLTGKTVTLKASIGGGTVKSWLCSNDLDQGANPGLCTYQLQAGDLDAAGKLQLQAFVVSGGATYKSKFVTRQVIASLA